MKSIVIYSSLTGNTKQVAEAITCALPEGTPCVSMSELPSDIVAYDLVFAGFWVDKGTANKEARDILGTLHNPHIALFATAGVPPQMEHAKQSLVNAAACLPEGVVPVDTFICQGKVDPKVIEMMYKLFPKGHSHGQSADRDARHKQAAAHPNEDDCNAAKAFAMHVLDSI
ncbi:flavodoxin family protein [uncultured Veillonella sp.]|uniref:flavodoxin family protein n=1 Tax=uncultured Veillonella sp. TaxID=159268 RepID=UPI0025F72207|nr:flavodoxin family protein [uncultured Veillonella sp.]